MYMKKIFFLFILIISFPTYSTQKEEDERIYDIKKIFTTEMFIKNKQGICYSVLYPYPNRSDKIISHTVVNCKFVKKILISNTY